MSTYTDIQDKRDSSINDPSTQNTKVEDYFTNSNYNPTNLDDTVKGYNMQNIAAIPSYFNNNVTSNMMNTLTKGMQLYNIADKLKTAGTLSKAAKIGGVATAAASEAMGIFGDQQVEDVSKRLNRYTPNRFDNSSVDAYNQSIKNITTPENIRKYRDIDTQSIADKSTGILSSMANGALTGASLGGPAAMPAAILGGLGAGIVKGGSLLLRGLRGNKEVKAYQNKRNSIIAQTNANAKIGGQQANMAEFNRFRKNSGYSANGLSAMNNSNFSSPNIHAFGGALDFDNNQAFQNNAFMGLQNNNNIKSMPNSFSPNSFAEGGMMTPFHQNLDGGMEINEGGTHEENPYGGVQIGTDPDGQPNLVEQDEVVHRLQTENGPQIVVFSNRLGYAAKAKKILKEKQERENDPISERTVNAQLLSLYTEQEEQKRKEAEERQMQQMQGMNYNDIQGIEGLQEPGLEQQMMQQQMSPQEMPVDENYQEVPSEMSEQSTNFAARGGRLNIFDEGGPVGLDVSNPNWGNFNYLDGFEGIFPTAYPTYDWSLPREEAEIRSLSQEPDSLMESLRQNPPGKYLMHPNFLQQMREKAISQGALPYIPEPNDSFGVNDYDFNWGLPDIEEEIGDDNAPYSPYTAPVTSNTPGIPGAPTAPNTPNAPNTPEVPSETTNPEDTNENEAKEKEDLEKLKEQYEAQRESLNRRRKIEGLMGIAANAGVSLYNAMPLDRSTYDGMVRAANLSGLPIQAPSLESGRNYTPTDHSALFGNMNANHARSLGNISNLSGGNMATAIALQNASEANYNNQLSQTYLDLLAKDNENRNQIMRYNGEVAERNARLLSQTAMANQAARAKQAEGLQKAEIEWRRMKDSREQDMGQTFSGLAQSIDNYATTQNNRLVASLNPGGYDSNGMWTKFGLNANPYADALTQSHNSDDAYNKVRGTQIKQGRQ